MSKAPFEVEINGLKLRGMLVYHMARGEEYFSGGAKYKNREEHYPVSIYGALLKQVAPIGQTTLEDSERAAGLARVIGLSLEDKKEFGK